MPTEARSQIVENLALLSGQVFDDFVWISPSLLAF